MGFAQTEPVTDTRKVALRQAMLDAEAATEAEQTRYLAEKSRFEENPQLANNETEFKTLQAKHGALRTLAEKRDQTREQYREYLEELANGPGGDGPAAPPQKSARFLRMVKGAEKGDPAAYSALASEFKTWIEGTDSAGGFLVSPEILPGYIAQRRATSPLRDRCANFNVQGNEVWIALEGNSIQVAHTAEAATKLDSTGTVAQKISTVFKVAGTTHLSDELLDDSNGLASNLVAKQFGEQMGISVDSAIISGTGVGQPTGILNAAGVTSTAVDGQTGQALYGSIAKAMSRLSVKFFSADSVVMHPREAVKFDLAVDSAGNYLFPNGIDSRLGGARVVLDANIPANLGVGTNQTVMIVGNLAGGCYFFNRQGLTIEASRDAGWVEDVTIFRGIERYGFVVAAPSAIEILTGITP